VHSEHCNNAKECAAREGHMGNAYAIIVGKLEEKRPFGRAKRRWKIS
jgi:hypothetical protein